MTTHPFAYLNHHYIESAKAAISPQDRGFRFGDGVFETIRVNGGRPLRLAGHLVRLADGLNALRIHAHLENLPELCASLIRKNNVGDGILRISVTRGVGSRGYMPLSPDQPPTLFIETLDLPAAANAPVDIWLSSYEKISPKALPVNFKLSQGINSTLARLEALENNCGEALLLNAEGHIAECSASNLFWLKGGTLYTPSLGTGALAGVTRAAILDLSAYPAEEGEYVPEDLKSAEAVVLTNAVMGAQPVHSLLPLGTRFKSEALAKEINQWLEDNPS